MKLIHNFMFYVFIYSITCYKNNVLYPLIWHAMSNTKYTKFYYALQLFAHQLIF